MKQTYLSAERIEDSSDEVGSELSEDEPESRKPEKAAEKRKANNSQREVGTAGTKRQKTTVSRERQQNGDSKRKENFLDNAQADRTRSPEENSSNNSSSRESVAPSPEAPAILDGRTETTRVSASPATSVSSDIATSWQPPKGFKNTPKVAQDTNRLVQLFSDRSLAGKELWHITMPAKLPMENIPELMLKHINSDKTALSHEGVDYTFATDDQTSYVPLVSNGDCTSYSTTTSKFAKHLKLRKAARGRPLMHNAYSLTEDQPRPPRPQPKGLRTRFWPAGFEDVGYIDAGGRSDSNNGDNSETSVTETESESEPSSPSPNLERVGSAKRYGAIQRKSQQEADTASEGANFEDSSSSEASDSEV